MLLFRAELRCSLVTKKFDFSATEMGVVATGAPRLCLSVGNHMERRCSAVLSRLNCDCFKIFWSSVSTASLLSESKRLNSQVFERTCASCSFLPHCASRGALMFFIVLGYNPALFKQKITCNLKKSHSYLSDRDANTTLGHRLMGGQTR